LLAVAAPGFSALLPILRGAGALPRPGCGVPLWRPFSLVIILGSLPPTFLFRTRFQQFAKPCIIPRPPPRQPGYVESYVVRVVAAYCLDTVAEQPVSLGGADRDRRLRLSRLSPPPDLQGAQRGQSWCRIPEQDCLQPAITPNQSYCPLTPIRTMSIGETKVRPESARVQGCKSA
jgi:hypothetical protein